MVGAGLVCGKPLFVGAESFIVRADIWTIKLHKNTATSHWFIPPRTRQRRELDHRVGYKAYRWLKRARNVYRASLDAST